MEDLKKRAELEYRVHRAHTNVMRWGEAVRVIQEARRAESIDISQKSRLFVQDQLRMAIDELGEALSATLTTETGAESALVDLAQFRDSR